MNPCDVKAWLRGLYEEMEVRCRLPKGHPGHHEAVVDNGWDGDTATVRWKDPA